MADPVGRNHIQFNGDEGTVVLALRNADPPTVTGGYGGWEVVPRPRRTGLTQWVGKDPIRVKIPIIFDGWESGHGIEEEIGKLVAISVPGANQAQPPTLDIQGAVPAKWVTKWVIESLEFGQNVIWARRDDGSTYRLRQDVVVNLLQYIDEDRVFGNAPKPKPRKRPKPKHRFHIVRAGETLRSIAAKEYGNQKWWRDIASANNIRPGERLRVGRRLRMP